MNEPLRVGFTDERYFLPYGFLVLVLLATFGCSGSTYQLSSRAMTTDASALLPASRPAAPAPLPLEEAKIRIDHLAFNPPMLTIPAGTIVSWTNFDTDEHTITSSIPQFASGRLDPGASYSYRFAAAGTYVYFCALHPGMTARIVVQ
ncbi:MAG TPA: plastocyanin/azurin family copper-binding protein [Chloroflexota bacterium]|nr:plastocyanin/azurin family copper-binding protein [Chloroflexota bacterium]